MTKQQLSQIFGAAGIAMFVFAATLFALNSPQRSLMGFLSGAGAILVLAYAVINIRAISELAGRRSAKQGANTALTIILVTGIVVIVQALSMRHSLRIDLTKNQRFSLAEQTRNILSELSDDVWIYSFFQKGADERFRAEELLDQYAHASSRVRYELIDPDRKPQRAKEMGITTYGTTIVRFGTKSEPVKNLTEDALTNAILKVTSDVAKSIYFVVGHDEKSPFDEAPTGYSVMREAVEQQNYYVKPLSLFDVPEIPEDCYILVVAGPAKDYTENEISKIEDYLAGGRNALFMIDARVELPNLEQLLAANRILLDDNLVIDPFSRMYGGDYTVPVVTGYADHPITRNFNNVGTFYPVARSVSIRTDEVLGVRAEILATTGNSAWGETDLDGISRGKAVKDDVDAHGPVPIAAVAKSTYVGGQRAESGPDESTIVVFGDSDFVANNAFRVMGNSDLFLNVINYLAEEKNLVAIRARPGMGDQLFLRASQGRMIFFLSVILLPLAVVVVGGTVFIRQRRTG